ncbi:MAG: hypothetical protein CMJ83_18030, partial [Planctomycetes bacterium]|nr:hypothetical protein [Planctomycetota bacterium]
MHVLLTGATGFIGSRVATRLIGLNHRVTALVREPARLEAALQRSLQIVRADLAEPLPEGLLEGRRIDVLIHAAAETAPDARPDRLERINRHGTRHTVEAALAAGARRIILVSCLEAAGPRTVEEAPAFESSTPQPVTARGASWLAAESEVDALCREAGATLVVLRPGHVYGEGHPGFIKELVHPIVTGQPQAIYDDLINYLWQPIHVEDVVTGVIRTLDRGEAVYHLTDGKSHTVASLLEDLAFVATWRNIETPPFDAPDRMEASEDPVHYVYTADRANRDLGFEPAWSFRRGILDIVDGLGLGLPRLEVAEAYGRLRTFLVNTPAGPVKLNRDMGGGMGFVHDNQDRFPPLDLLWLAATLHEKGWPVTVADGSIAPFTPGNLLHLMVTRGVHCVVAEVNLPTFEQDLDFLRRLRHYSSARIVAKTVLTEEHFHERLLKEAGVDMVITGECDLTIDQVLLGRDRRGTVWLEEGQIKSEEETRVQDLDRLPMPARHLL